MEIEVSSNLAERIRNKYDIFLFLLIASFAFGGLGGSMQVPRILALLFLPQFVPLAMQNRVANLNTFLSFFIFWYIYSAVSLLWTSDLGQAMKEMFYYPMHFLIFLEIAAFASQAGDRLRTISIAWILAFLGTSVVALWEIQTNNHLAISVQQTGYTMNNGSGEFLLRRFASVAFGNYNCYCIFICYTLPFILYQIYLSDKNTTWNWVGIVSLFLAMYILFINGTRGGILALGTMLAVFAFYSFRIHRKRNRLIVYVITILILVAVYKYADIIFETIRYRLYATDMVDDSIRKDVWEATIGVFMNSYGIGAGVGSMVASLSDVRMAGDVVATHNLFLEILLQYGILILAAFALFLFHLFRDAWYINGFSQKMVAMCTLLSMPFVSIVNSGYLLEPMVWGAFASLYIFVYTDEENEYDTEFAEPSIEL